MYLFLNTSYPDTAEYVISDRHGRIAIRKKNQTKRGRFDILDSLIRSLKRLDCQPRYITCIYVVLGPGMFSHLRTGSAIVQSWRFACPVPLVALHSCEFPHTEKELQILIARKKPLRSISVLPLYGSEPHITQRKK